MLEELGWSQELAEKQTQRRNFLKQTLQIVTKITVKNLKHPTIYLLQPCLSGFNFKWQGSEMALSALLKTAFMIDRSKVFHGSACFMPGCCLWLGQHTLAIVRF